MYSHALMADYIGSMPRASLITMVQVYLLDGYVEE